MNHMNHNALFGILLFAMVHSASAQSSFLDFADSASTTMDAMREYSAPSDIRAIFTKARRSVEDNYNVALCGFYAGMSAADAQTLAAHYKLKDDEWSIEGDPVYQITLSLKGVRQVTKGGNTFDELAQAVANRVGSMKHNYHTDSYEMKTIDGITVTMSESGGFKLFSSPAQEDSERRARAREAAERREREEREAAERRRAREDCEPARAESISAANPAIISKLIECMVPIPGKDYRMGKFEVTQSQWEAVMGRNPSQFKDADNPVENVSWLDCQEFLRKLNMLPAVKKSGLVFRLPTEDEWEHACRAGATGRYCKLANGTEITESTLGQVAWFADNSDGKTHPVGRKKPNAFGLYDMHGNVLEWCQDEFGEVESWAKGTDGEHDRVGRGGSWFLSTKCCGTSDRRWSSPFYRDYRLGFRLCASGKAD